MDTFSFDIVSEVDMQEVDNAINQTKKELSSRYDFKASKFSVDFDRPEKKIKLLGENDFKLRAMKEVLISRMAKRNVAIKALVFKEPEKSFEGTLTQMVEISTGVDREKAKDLVKIIKDLNVKVQVQIEGEKLRVSSPKKDALQAVITHLRSIDFPLALTFCNYR